MRIPALLGGPAVDLSHRLDELVTLTVVDEDDVYPVHEAVRPRTLVIACHVGDQLPIDRCAPGVLSATTWDAGRWDRFRTGHGEHRPRSRHLTVTCSPSARSTGSS